jgi:hypothetical protein
LRQLATFLAPRSVDAAEGALRQFARWMLTDADITAVGDIRRDDIEDYKVRLAGLPGHRGRLSAETHRQRLRTIRQSFERIIEWDWPDAPPRNPVIAGDIPKSPSRCRSSPGDRDAARLMAAVRAGADPRDRLVVELLARTGMRAGELAGLDADAVVRIGAGHWLRIRSASSATTGTSPCTPSSSACSPPGPPISSTSAGASAWSPTTAARWTGTSSAASSPAPAAPPRSPACIPTGCATRWQPRPSTAACGWRPSPPCPATARWR